MIWWLYLIIIIMYSSATEMHNSGTIPACMCHIWSHRDRNTSTLHNHKLISLPYWRYGKPINLKYLIATHVPVQIVNKVTSFYQSMTNFPHMSVVVGCHQHLCLLFCTVCSMVNPSPSFLL
jgi:hypothetical protein